MRKLTFTALSLFTAAASLLAFAGGAAAATPKTPSFGRSIESQYTAYVPQKGCDQSWTKRPGTEKLVALLKRTYPNVYSQGAYKCGTDGTVSEHYEGRAIDWMASHSSAKTRGEADSMIKWLLATDKYGNKYANARRLGIMYIIWDNRILGSWDWKWENYNGCMAAKMQASKYANQCHRTHVHLSLTWNGAMGRTTFWGHSVTATDYGICKKNGKYTGYRAKSC